MTNSAEIPPAAIPATTPPAVVAIVLFDGIVSGDFVIPCEIFSRARLDDGRPAYDVRLCGVTRQIQTDRFTLTAPFELASLRCADMIIVPGIDSIDCAPPPVLLAALQSAAQRGARIASICTGAFVMAAAGLLDGIGATTHWRAAAELARRYPLVDVDPNVLYVDNGNILTSAGAAAGSDLCLHIVRRDHGAAVAAHLARLCVIPLERAGGQAQFIEHKDPDIANSSLQALLSWVASNLHKPLSVDVLARRAALSTRSLHRHFLQQTGTTPTRWILRARISRAQQLLETTAHSIEWVGVESGFGSTANFREQFRKIIGTSPNAYRSSFRSSCA